MIRALMLASYGTLFTFAMTALGAGTVFFLGGARRRTQSAMLGFAAGVMTAASVWSLLLPAIEQAGGGALPAWLPAAAGVTVGAAFLAALDGALPRLRRLSDDPLRRRNALLFTAVTLHNIPEGMAVGLAFALAADGAGLSRRGAVRRGGAAVRRGDGACRVGRGRADAVAAELRRRGDALCHGGGAGAPVQHARGRRRLHGGLRAHDVARRGAGVSRISRLPRQRRAKWR